MKPSLRIFLTLLTLCLAAVASAQDRPALQDFDGQPRTIESFQGNGKWLVVKFWSHDCHVCNLEAEAYAMFHEAHHDADATVLGVSINGLADKAAAQAYIDRHDLPFPNLIGQDTRETLQLYRQLTGSAFLGTPSILLFDPSGQLRAAQAGAVPTDAIAAFIERDKG
jgi:peroxiredoxin